MKHILFFTLSLVVIAFGCSSAKKAQTSTDQGLTGRITEVKGNQMPMKDAAPSAGKGVLTKVLIYEPTTISQTTRVGTSSFYTAIHTKQVASVDTDSTGAYTISLPEGSYSVFIQRDKQFYANLFDTGNRIAHFTVEKGKLTTANLVISAGASH
jgi:hypothetical protein